jgi:methyl-accepting chemotaxis protein
LFGFRLVRARWALEVERQNQELTTQLAQAQALCAESEREGAACRARFDALAAERAQAESALSSSQAVRDKIKFTQKKIIEDIQENINRLIAEVAEVSTSLISISSASEEISSSTVEISATTGSIKEFSRKVAEKVQASKSKAGENAERLATLTETFTVLKEHSQAIQELVEVIKGITGQLNLLAMNAAIEAAHAQESGRGFAVVAEEVRKLADSTSVKSKEITDLVKRMHQSTVAIDQDISTMKVSTSQLNALSDEITDMIVSVSQGMGEQDIGIKQILDGLSSLTGSMVSVKEKYELITNSTSFMTRYLGSLSKYIDKG